MDLSSVDVEDLLTRLDLGGARLTSGGREINFDCFGPEHNDGGSAYINIETTAWFCHGCKRRGNAVGLVAEVHDVARATAERTLSEWYGIEFDEPLHGSMVAETEARFRDPEPEVPPAPPPASWLFGARLDWRDPRDPFQHYMLERGFLPETLEEWDVGYDFLSDRLTIPVFDISGELVGIKGRDWTGEREPKYLILGDRQYPRYGFHPYLATEVVFGLHRNRGCRRVVLCEGELNAMALAQLGVERPIAAGMSYFGERHLQLIIREAEEVVVYYDLDPAGSHGMWGYTDSKGVFVPGAVQLLEPHVKVSIAQALPEDPADLVQAGRGHEALAQIELAQSSLALAIESV